MLLFRNIFTRCPNGGNIIKNTLCGGGFIFDLYRILISLPGVILAITIHEYIKCLTASRLGDAVLKTKGRLSFNPLKHVDPLGAIFMLIFGYGWANPAPVSAFRMRGGRNSMIIVFLMPFLANIVFGAIFAIGAQLLVSNFEHVFSPNYQTLIIISDVLARAAVLNIGFAFFSLVPIYPLDGINLVSAFKPMWAVKIAQAEKILQIVLAFSIILGFANTVFGPIVMTIMRGLII